MTPNRLPVTPDSEPGGGAGPVEARPALERDLIRLTRSIWEDKAIGAIYTRYAHNTPVHLPDAELYGREQLVERTLQALAPVPDARLHGDEMISQATADGVLSSHRVTVSGHHLGHGPYGPPTGHAVQWRGITQRLMQGGRVVEEWSVHDELAVVRQLGLDEWALARTLAQRAAEAGTGGPAHPAGEVVRGAGQASPPLPVDATAPLPGDLPGHIAAVVWNARMLNLTGQYYAPDATIRVPGYARLHGPAQLTRYVLEWLAAFPDGAMHVEQVTGTGDDAQGFKFAARWAFVGTHTGAGVYGHPTGQRVRISGISHYDVTAGRIRREDMVWNGFALLKQLCRPSSH